MTSPRHAKMSSTRPGLHVSYRAGGSLMGVARFQPVQSQSSSKAKRDASRAHGKRIGAELIPDDASDIEIDIDGRKVRLTNLQKPFWPQLGLSKRDLLRYYAEVSSWLVPHLRDRAMVMKRYPNGAAGGLFFQKSAPVPRPGGGAILLIEHRY